MRQRIGASAAPPTMFPGRSAEPGLAERNSSIRARRNVSGRVLIIVENIPVGMDHRVSKQVETLLQNGYEVRVITRKDPHNELYRKRCDVRLLEYPAPPEPGGIFGYLIEYGYSFLAAVFLSIWAMFSGRTDVVQFCQPPDIYFPLGWLFRRLGARVVIDQRDLLAELYSARYGGKRACLVAALRRLERLSHSRADQIICVNEYLRKRALAASGLPADQISVVRNGPVFARVNRSRANDSLKQGRPYLCCWVGVMGRQDRLDLLLRSIHHVVHGIGRRDCEFAIIGAGECLDEARALARDLSLDEWVHFTGWLREDQLFCYLATADLGVDASLQFEASPVKAMEYMAFGVPFVAFDLPETREISDGAAVFAEAGDVQSHGRAIHRLLADPEWRQALGTAGKARVRDQLAWEKQARTYARVIGLSGTDGGDSSRGHRSPLLQAADQASHGGVAGQRADLEKQPRRRGRPGRGVDGDWSWLVVPEMKPFLPRQLRRCAGRWRTAG